MIIDSSSACCLGLSGAGSFLNVCCSNTDNRLRCCLCKIFTAYEADQICMPGFFFVARPGPFQACTSGPLYRYPSKDRVRIRMKI